MTSSPSLAHDQPIPFDNTSDQRNDPFNFTNVPSTQSTTTTTQPLHKESGTNQDASSLFGNTGDSTFLNQTLENYSHQTAPLMHQQPSTVVSQVPQQQCTSYDLYQQQQQYQPTDLASHPHSYEQTSAQEQQYVPSEVQHQGYQQDQWQQFDPNVHYYYDEQGQYHYYDPNTGQEYDYTQYAYQTTYDPQQYYMDDQQQQQYTTAITTTNTLVMADLEGKASTDLPQDANYGYTADTTSQQNQHQAQEVGNSNLHTAESQPLDTSGMTQQPPEQKLTATNSSMQQGAHIQDTVGLAGQVDNGNEITNNEGQNSLAPLRQMTPQLDSLPQSTLASQSWDQVDMDSQNDVLLVSQANGQPSTLHTDKRIIDALGDDLDDLILGGGAKQSDKLTTTAPPPTTMYTPSIYNNQGSRSATPQLPTEATITCVNPSCQTINKPASKFCEECGTPFVSNGSRAPTPAISTSYQPVAAQETTTTAYDPSAYNRAYSPAIPDNRYSPATAVPPYDLHGQQQQRDDYTQRSSTPQYSQSQLYNTHTGAPTYSEPQQYISRSVTPVYNPLTPNQGQDSSIYGASPSHPIYPSANTTTSVYEPSYYNGGNITTPAPPISNQQAYPSDAYSPAPVATSATVTTQQPPIDQDPLQRSNGCALIQFGFGGKLCMMFPRSVQHYGGTYGSSSSPKKTPGAIQIKKVKDIMYKGDSYDDNSTQVARLEAFVGPLLQDPDLSVKNKKKQILGYMDQKIAEMENTPSTTNGSSDAQVRILLWKLIRLMVEQDGNIMDSESTNKNILDLLRPTSKSITEDTNSFSVPAYDKLQQAQQQSQGSDVSDQVLDKLQDYLAQGDRRGAVNYAIQEDLWSHALIISSCVDRNMWQSVVRGFTQRDLAVTSNKKRERVHHHVEGNRQGLRVLYALFSGLGASSLSEFFVTDKRSPQAMGNYRAHTPDGTMAKTHPTLQPDELYKWQEILGLIMANRTAKDYEAITALGDIMKNHDWINAAHICYLLSPQSSPHSGLDTPYVRYTLVGTNSLLEIIKDVGVDSYILTEIVEFALSLRTVANGGGGCLPFLQGYKLAHAWWLADLGLVKEATRYCTAINQCIKTHSKESPYLHQHLTAKVKELTKLCNEYHGKKGIGMDVTSWLKPSFKKNTLDSFWGSIEGKFNKFVSGDDTQLEESTGRKSTEIKATTFETNIEPPARSASAVDFRMQQPSQMASYLNFKRFK